MSCETLYENLLIGKKNEDLTIEEKNKFCENCANLTREQKETFYTLILHHYSKATPSSKVVYPYKIKQLNSDQVEIKIDTLPNQLKQILYQFCNVAISNNIQTSKN